MTTSLLNMIEKPQDLKRLTAAQLLQLARELRQFILASVAKTGGHLSSNLGVVELTVALHYVFNLPQDKLIWDVGHQSYAHKILTGRRAAMAGLRQYHGISGFPSRSESEYDAFGTAHSSTSISAALGMAMAAQLKGQDNYSIAVIGDGAMTAGMAFEALNNAGAQKDAKLIVILNDNEMSISKPVGALNNYLVQLLSDNFFLRTKQISEDVISAAPPPLAHLAQKIKQTGKHILMPDNIFETLGFHYVGPINGHDLPTLVKVLESVKKFSGPQLIHVVTTKGYGYKLAEKDPITYHGPGSFDPAKGVVSIAAPQPTFSEVFGRWLCDMAARDKRLIGITPAMKEGSGMVEFAQKFPKRYFDVGIAEQHSVTFAAGLACEGLKPVVAIYSTFLQRAYDQLLHDVALQKLPVVFAVDRAGIVGADGATHNGVFDIAYARCIPGVSIACPSDINECRQLLSSAYAQEHPTIVRYPRGRGVNVAVQDSLEALPFGRAAVKRQGKQIAFIAFGPLVYEALALADELDATVVDMRWAKPLDEQMLHNLALTHAYLVSIEEGCIAGGAGSAVAEYLAAQHLTIDLMILGISDSFVEHGDRLKLLELQQLTADGILKRVYQRWPQLQAQSVQASKVC